MKRLSLALAMLGLSSAGLAAFPAATDPTLISIPQLPGGFVIGITGDYLKPSVNNGDLDYAQVLITSGINFTSDVAQVELGYDWGWGVNAGYIFPNTGNDINASYYQFDTDNTTGSITLAGSTPLITPFISVADGYNFAAPATAKIDLNQVDLTVGQFINVGCRLQLHPNVGFRYAEIERKLDSFFSLTNLLGVVTNSLVDNNKSEFTGLGPLMGIDASYYIVDGVGLVAHADGALLVGDMDATALVSPFSTIAVVAPTFSNIKFNATRIVPVVDAKLGANYTFVFNSNSDEGLTLEAGYQFDHYFNAIDRLSILRTGGSTGQFVAQGRTSSSLGLNGAYVNLTLRI